MCLLFLVIIMQEGSLVNGMLEAHSQTMCAHNLRLHRKVENLQLRLKKVPESNKEERKKFEERIEKLESGRHAHSD